MFETKSVPMSMLQNLKGQFPLLQQKAELLVSQKGSVLPDWVSLCYCPILNVTAALTTCGISVDKAFVESYEAAALLSWELNKKEYHIPHDLDTNVLPQCDPQSAIPVDTLKHLQSNALFTKTNRPDVKDFFAFYNHNQQASQLELYMPPLNGNEKKECFVLPLIEGTIESAVRAYTHSCKSNYKNYNFAIFTGMSSEVCDRQMDFFNSPERELEKYMVKEIGKYLQLIIYVCSEGKKEIIDVDPNNPCTSTTQAFTPLSQDCLSCVHQFDTNAFWEQEYRKSQILARQV